MSLTQSIDALLRSAVAAGHIPGVVAGVTTRRETIYLDGFGERTLGGGVAMTPDTVGWLASMTKAITGAAAMCLVEQGRLDLDRPAADVVPHLGEVEVLEGFDGAGRPLLRAATRQMTLRHLLTHTAGFGYDLFDLDTRRYQEALALPDIISGKKAALMMPLLFDPGERWTYGINMDWVGQMVEVVSGRRLGDFLRATILDPLGMNDTGFKITPDMGARLAAIHLRGDDGRIEPIDLVLEQEPEFEMGGGGLYSTVGDYLEFIRMILNRGAVGGDRVLAAESVAMMSVNQMGANRVRRLVSAIPAFSNDVEFFPGMDKTWGLSFLINTERAPTGRSAGSLGWAGMANSYFWIDPAKGIGGVYLTQMFPFVDVKSFPLYLEFEKAVYRAV